MVRKLRNLMVRTLGNPLPNRLDRSPAELESARKSETESTMETVETETPSSPPNIILTQHSYIHRKNLMHIAFENLPLPDLQSLRYWGSCLRGQWRRAFERKHGNLLRILEVEICWQDVSPSWIFNWPLP
ncbi:hypothetical protein CR513_25409, partial [Mucuna pruriens]